MAFLRKKGKYWQICYWDNDANKQRERTTKQTNVRAAELKLKEFVEKHNPNRVYIPANSTKINLSAALKLYVEDRRIEENISPATAVSYKRIINRFINTLGDREVIKITLPVVKEYNKILREDAVSQTTFATYNNHFHAVFNWLIKNGYYHYENPFTRRKPEDKEPQAFPPVKRILLFARLKKDKRFEQYAAVGLTYYFALRIEETAQLLSENFDMKNMILDLRNRKGVRDDTIPILDDAYKFIQTINLPKTGRLFPSYKNSIAIESWWKRLRVTYEKKYKMNLEYKFHSLRAARATDLLNSGHDLYFVKEFMRHRDIKTTLKHYTKRKIDLQRIEMNKKIKTRLK
jgi:site-specific recombinase XerD